MKSGARNLLDLPCSDIFSISTIFMKMRSFIIFLALALYANFNLEAGEPYKKIQYTEVIPEGTQILDALGKDINSTVIENKFTIVFLSVSWCGPCKYMGKYLKTYADIHKEYVTVILVGLDKSEKQHWYYVRSYDGSFHTIKYKHKPFKELWGITARSLGGRYEKSGGIPVLLCYDNERNFVEGITTSTFKNLNYKPWENK